ncbi:MAG: hypothetical protein H6581_23780 [Bacteroidia bacterium]|nr:hypothetical protein [Bacteroidia bacterium]
MKASKSYLEKLEGIFKSLEFVVRYEKGNFNSGYCILESKNVVVINKFFPLESKINALTEILNQIEIDRAKLDSGQQKLISQLNQQVLQF